MARRHGAARVALASPIACGGADDSAPGCAVPPPATIVGTWAVVGYVDGHSPAPASAAGEDSSAALRPARGYLVYDAGGRLLAQIVHAPRTATSRHGWATASQEQLVELLRGQTAFHGTYVVDTAGRRVVHRIEHESPPGPGQYEQILPCRIDGDTLHVGATSVRQWVLRRVSPPAYACGDERTTTNP